MEAWRAKVERIGNLNYPGEAKRRRLSGRLRLDVAINADGTVNAITLRESSGHKLLDDAAQRIVELAGPFAPFSDDIRAEADILHITRTWKFNDNSMTSEN
jgi:protein TonB